ncbi:MAG: aldo/keto reductase [Spirochaetales bacterium]|nr:aldo/keto reductase [Spirochaetales bacterium]
MEYTILGRTGLNVTRTSFGVLPLQRVPMEEAVLILQSAFNRGINFYDTARAYSDSEEKIGRALSHVREKIIISTKSVAQKGEDLLKDLETSLKNLKTDYIDILQFHNPQFLPHTQTGDSIYTAAEKAREQGKIRFIGITNHSLKLAIEAVESDFYDTMQFPLSMISSQEDLGIIDLCKKKNIGLIAMKALSGGLITNAPLAFAFLRQFSHVVPIWGIQKMKELDQLLELDAKPPAVTEKMSAEIEKEKKELAGQFCRACGYCLPCPADIPIPMAARMSLLLNRMPWEQFLEPQWQEKMARIDACTECHHCKDHCPYGLDTPNLLRENYRYYREFLKKKSSVDPEKI